MNAAPLSADVLVVAAAAIVLLIALARFLDERPEPLPVRRRIVGPGPKPR